MLDHQVNEFVIGERLFRQSQILIDILFGPQDVLGRELGFFQQRLQLGFCKGLFVIVDRHEGLAALFQQLHGLPTGRAGGFVINLHIGHAMPLLR